MTRLCSVTGHGKKRKIKEETVAITDPAARHEAAWMKAEPRREAVPTAKAECGPWKPCLSGNALRTSRHCREGPWRCGPGWRGPGGVRAGRTDESQGRQRAPQHLGWASSPPTPSTCPRSPVTTSGPSSLWAGTRAAQDTTRKRAQAPWVPEGDGRQKGGGDTGRIAPKTFPG